MRKDSPCLPSHPWALPPFWLLGRFPTPVSPVVSQWKDMMGTAFSLAIVGYVINLAVGRTLASKHGYDVDSNQVGPCGQGQAGGAGSHRGLARDTVGLLDLMGARCQPVRRRGSDCRRPASAGLGV